MGHYHSFILESVPQHGNDKVKGEGQSSENKEVHGKARKTREPNDMHADADMHNQIQR